MIGISVVYLMIGILCFYIFLGKKLVSISGLCLHFQSSHINYLVVFAA